VLLRIRLFAVLFMFCGAFLLGVMPGRANSLTDSSGPIHLPGLLDVLEDVDGTLTIADVSAPDGRGMSKEDRFRPLGQANPYLGFQDSVWWGRFTLTNPSDEAATLILELMFPVIDRIELYEPAGTGADFRVRVLGDSVVQKSTDGLQGHLPSFRLNLPAGESRTYYLRLSGQSALSFEGQIWGGDNFIDNKATSFDINLPFFGVLLTSAFYCLFLFFVFRDQSHLMFAIAILAVAIYQAEFRGYLSAYLWPASTWISNLTVILSASVILTALARFTSVFLNFASNAPSANVIFKGIQVLGPVALLLSFADYHAAARFLILGIVLGNVLALIVSVYLWTKGVVYARIYALCWAIFCTFAIVIGAGRLGFLPVNPVFDTMFLLGISISIIILASAFYDRFRVLSEASQRRYKKARDEAIAASRAKSTFLATMSHELRTPLNAVIGFSEILAKESDGAERAKKSREYALNILDSGKHLLSIINNLLMLSRIEAGHVTLGEKSVEVPELLRRCCKIVQKRADENEITLKADVVEPLSVLRCDEKLVQDVLVNLLQNAVKFTPMGGRVELQACMEEDGLLSISVSDTGIGIAEQDIARVMEPFTQIGSHLTREHGGLGLGLAIVNAILGLHKGHLIVESEVGKGSKFTVRFPAERLVKVS
jgi:signal transduction histidine kinase